MSMYIKITRDGKDIKVKKVRRRARTAIELEAFGPYDMLPKEVYSKHNLELKYETKNPAAIVAGRIKTAIGFGYDPAKCALTQDDKETMLTLDYLDALFGTYRIRVLYGMQNEKYMDSLNSEWTWQNVMEKEWVSRSAPRMLGNFMRTMSTAQLWLENLIETPIPEFIKEWSKELLRQIEEDTNFYNKLKVDFDTIIDAKLAAI